eukprot:4527291-Ditylum_brightwellii.AAC.1
MNKEDKHCYVILLPNWLARFIAHIHVTPQDLIIKPGKNDSLVFDGSNLQDWNSLPVNRVAHTKNDPMVTFDQALTNHLIKIWNLRIIYSFQNILLCDEDISGCFCHCKLHPDTAPVYCFIITALLFLPCSNAFGSNTSPANWEPLR